MVITQYSKFQFKICFDKVTGFLKKSVSLNTRFAAKTQLAIGEFLLVAKNKKCFIKLHKCTLIPVAAKTDWQHFRPEQTEDKNTASQKVLSYKSRSFTFFKNPRKYQKR